MKNAFITGASNGIGKAVALTLAEEGYDIAFTYHTDRDGAQAVQDAVTAMGRRCFFYQAALDRADVPERVARQAAADLGGIDVMVCNAGHTVPNSLLTSTAEQVDYMYGLIYRAYILCAKVAAQSMIDRNVAGNIIFITSTRGIRAYPEDCFYGSMKAALHRGCESIALELSQYGIRVNCVAPGAIAIRGDFSLESLRSRGVAPKIPLKRFGSPYEVAAMVRFLISEQAGYITGSVMKMDGGLILPGMPEDVSPEAGYGWGRFSLDKSRG